MFVSHPILHLHLYLLFWKKKVVLQSKATNPPFNNSFSVCWEPLCQLRAFHIPVTTPYGKGHFRVTSSEAQDLPKQTGPLSFALPFPLFTWGFRLEQRGCASLIRVRTGEGDPQLTLCSPRGPSGAPAVGRRSISALSQIKDTGVNAALALDL